MTVSVQDQAVYLKGDWWALVEGRLHGPFNSRGAALAGVSTERRRADKCASKINHENFDELMLATEVFLQGRPIAPLLGETIFINSLYQVNVRILSMEGDRPSSWHLSIKRRDRKPVTNWRHFQWIKNDICGEETTGIEFYPPESQLVDTANQYHLWVFDKTIDQLVDFGWCERLVAEGSYDGAVQEDWPEDRRPSDLKTPEEIRAMKAEYMKGGDL